jgi:hypothetical protein
MQSELIPVLLEHHMEEFMWINNMVYDASIRERSDLTRHFATALRTLMHERMHCGTAMRRAGAELLGTNVSRSSMLNMANNCR